jgi:HK97 family phage major capsid protein
MKQAEQKAAEEAEQKAAAEEVAEKAAQEEQVKSTIRTGIETGAEKLMADMEADFEKASVDQLAEVTAKYQAELKEKSEELEQMRNSKRDFSGRGNTDIKSMGNELLGGHILGKITGKGWDTQLGQELQEKAGVTFTASTAVGIDASVSSAFEEEVRMATPVANLFREINVTSGSTVLPINPNSSPAFWGTAGPANDAGFLEDILNGTQGDDDGFATSEVLLRAYRLMSGTFIASDTDEQSVINVLPMIQNALSSSHAKAVDKMIMVGNGTIKGFTSTNGTDQGNAGHAHDVTAAEYTVGDFNLDISDADLLTAANINKSRRQMGKFGMNVSDLAVIMGPTQYYDLLNDAEFADVQQVGDLSAKATGYVGQIYGMDVIVTENIAVSNVVLKTAFVIVNKSNFVIPRLRGVSIESDYSVANQRTDIVASQSLGFNAITAGVAANGFPSVLAAYNT